MEVRLTDIEELALQIDLAWVKNFNKAGFFDVDGKYQAYVETACWAEDGYAPVTVMIYQETESQSFRIIVAYISNYHDGWCSEWYLDKRCPAEMLPQMRLLEKQLMNLYDPAWLGQQRKMLEEEKGQYGKLHIWNEEKH